MSANEVLGARARRLNGPPTVGRAVASTLRGASGSNGEGPCGSYRLGADEPSELLEVVRPSGAEGLDQHLVPATILCPVETVALLQLCIGRLTPTGALTAVAPGAWGP